MSTRSYQYAIAIGTLVLIGGIIIAINANKQEKEKTEKTPSNILTGLAQASTSSVSFADDNEGIKMTLPLALKNTVMSLEPLKYLTEKPAYSNNAINPYMNNNTGDFKFNISTLKYPDNIREGLFYIQIGNKVLSRYNNGDIYMESNISPDNFTLQRNTFDKTYKSMNVEPGDVKEAVFQPTFFKFAKRDDAKGSYQFYLKDFIGKYNNPDNGGLFNNFGKTSGRNFPGFLNKDKIYYIMHGTDATMLHPQTSGDGVGLVRADQWRTWEPTSEFNTKRNGVRFIQTGDVDGSYYIQFVINDGYFQAKDDNYVDYTGVLDPTNTKIKWYVKFSGMFQNGGVGAYAIESVYKKGLQLTWSGDVNASWCMLSQGSWLGIFEKNSFPWSGVVFKHLSLRSGGNIRDVWDDNIPVWNTVVQFGKGDNFSKAAYARNQDNKKFWNRTSNAGDCCWDNHMLLQTNNTTPQIPSDNFPTTGRLSDTADNLSCLFDVETDDRNRMFIRHNESGLYLSSLAPYLVPYDFAISMDHAVVKLHPVLDNDTTERASNYYKASLDFMKQKDTGRTTIFPRLCGYSDKLSNKFPDGTLKIGTDINGKISADRVTAGFEKICACNMDTMFYQNTFCPDNTIAEMYGNPDKSKYQSIRGTLKCDVPQCIYPLCKEMYNTTSTDVARSMNLSSTSECGAATLCFTTQVVNNKGVCEGCTFNFNNKQSCGNSEISNVSMTYTAPYFWKNPETKNIIMTNVKCSYKKGDQDFDISLNSPLCMADPDKQNLYDFSNSTSVVNITSGITPQIITTISNVTGGMSSDISQKLKEMILQKFNISNMSALISVDKDSKKITITESYTCPTQNLQSICEYNETDKKWITKSSFVKPSNLPSYFTQELFSKACPPSTTDGCALKKDCKIGPVQTTRSCSTEFSEEETEIPIIEYPSASGDSCEFKAAKIIDTNFKNFVVDESKNVVRASKACAENNTWSTNCSADINNVNKLIQKLTQCIPQGNTNCKDKVCIDWPTDATITTEYVKGTTPGQGTKKITVLLTNIDQTKLNTPEVRNFIKSKLNTTDEISYNYDTNKLVININYNCGTIEKEFESQCVYENSKWIKKYTNKYKNPINISEDQFNQNCKPQTLSGSDDCTEAKDCELTIDSTVSNSCINRTQKIGFTVSKNPSINGKSCINVAKQQQPEYTFSLDSSNSSKLIGTKDCVVSKTYEEKCSLDSNNMNRLLNKIKECTPAGSDECKDKFCIDWPSQTSITTNYEPSANQGKGKKIISVTMPNMDANMILTDPDVKSFIQTKLSVTDDVTYVYNGTTLVITINYSCGTLEKKYEPSCELLGDKWIRRYNQSYKNPINIEATKFQDLCNISSQNGSDNCDINQNCEVIPDTTIPSTCQNNKQKVSYKVTKPSNLGGSSCANVLSTIEPNVNFTLENGIYIGEKPCTPPSTPVNCIPSDWSDWGQCSKECDGGIQTRTRTITKEASSGGNCPEASVLQDSRACNTNACVTPINCKVSDWSEWGSCSKECGGGVKSRSRTITSPALNGGLCPESSNTSETQSCNTDACPVNAVPVNCETSDWSEWSSCSKTCDGGITSRTRTITKQASGGGVCPEASNTSEQKQCNTQSCTPSNVIKPIEPIVPPVNPPVVPVITPVTPPVKPVVPVTPSVNPDDKTNQILMIVIGVLAFAMIGGGAYVAMKKK